MEILDCRCSDGSNQKHLHAIEHLAILEQPQQSDLYQEKNLTEVVYIHSMEVWIIQEVSCRGLDNYLDFRVIPINILFFS